MGKPGRRYGRSPASEFIGCVVVTRGSETSQYPQEEKTIVIPLVVANERGRWLNRARVIPVRGCACGVVGPPVVGADSPARGVDVLAESAWNRLP